MGRGTCSTRTECGACDPPQAPLRGRVPPPEHTNTFRAQNTAQPPPPREGTSEVAPEAARQAVGGGCQSGWGRLLSVANAVDAGTCCQADSGWAQAGRPGGGGGTSPPFQCIPAPDPVGPLPFHRCSWGHMREPKRQKMDRFPHVLRPRPHHRPRPFTGRSGSGTGSPTAARLVFSHADKAIHWARPFGGTWEPSPCPPPPPPPPRGWAPEAERGRAPSDRRGAGPQKPRGAEPRATAARHERDEPCRPRNPASDLRPVGRPQTTLMAEPIPGLRGPQSRESLTSPHPPTPPAAPGRSAVRAPCPSTSAPPPPPPLVGHLRFWLSVSPSPSKGGVKPGIW